MNVFCLVFLSQFLNEMKCQPKILSSPQTVLLFQFTNNEFYWIFGIRIISLWLWPFRKILLLSLVLISLLAWHVLALIGCYLIAIFSAGSIDRIAENNNKKKFSTSGFWFLQQTIDWLRWKKRRKTNEQSILPSWRIEISKTRIKFIK